MFSHGWTHLILCIIVTCNTVLYLKTASKCINFHNRATHTVSVIQVWITCSCFPIHRNIWCLVETLSWQVHTWYICLDNLYMRRHRKHIEQSNFKFSLLLKLLKALVRHAVTYIHRNAIIIIYRGQS